ncbi:hypothetical protein HYALB_00011657 [Hymenoscyphus albidus]|uniref:Uncharacterized protein n=1 Tax=Hymenoscyphus albidus TaxID=595503 RepID=A0A9N9Q8H6_9HELO|nr:hypothetical protein HYALB_00011657 [Hymenoscyphus albidus]
MLSLHSQQEMMLRVSSETIPESTIAPTVETRRFTWTGSSDGSDDENDLESSESSDQMGESLEEDMALERTRAMFRAQEEEDARRHTLGPWTLEEAEDGVIVSLFMDSEDEDSEDEANWVHGDWFGTESWLGRGRGRGRHADY